MARRKATITVDDAKLNEARLLVGAPSASATIDRALVHLIRTERLRRDVEAYTGTPQTDVEIALGMLSPRSADLADETDWAALYDGDDR